MFRTPSNSPDYSGAYRLPDGCLPSFSIQAMTLLPRKKSFSQKTLKESYLLEVPTNL